jgi:broad specificity phosphatase PhoE
MICFLRHCEKVLEPHYNEKLDILDDPLSENGLSHAGRIADYFKDKDLDKIIVSKYQRTYQTALPTATLKGMSIEIDARVNEINGGKIKGMKESEIAEAYPEMWRDFSMHIRDVRFPGGESGADVIKRQDSFLEDMKKETGDILVVSHDGFIRILMCNILGAPVWHRYRMKTDYGALCIIEYDGKEWRVLKFNQII